MIAVVDYGAGNLQSIRNALERLDAPYLVASQPQLLAAADGVILPGVGAFRQAMSELNGRGLADGVKRAAKSGKPFLGICIGMQLFFEESEENPGVPGLGLMQGRVVRFRGSDGLKIPHMGWNQVELVRKSKLLSGLPKSPYMYFVHSYCVQAANRADVAAMSRYGMDFDAAVEEGLLFGVQFHPEKSGAVGLSVLKKFTELCGGAH